MPRRSSTPDSASGSRACTMEQDKAVVLQTLARICLHLRELQATPQSRRACEEIAAWLQQETAPPPPSARSARRSVPDA